MSGRFKVQITQTAEHDIEEIWDFIAQDSPANATRFILELEKQIQTLERFPSRCPIIPEDEILNRDYRHLLYEPYRTIFRIENKVVYILRVIHGARLLDTSALLNS